MSRQEPGKILPGSCDYEHFENSMKSKSLSKRALLVVVLAVFSLFAILLLYFIPRISKQRGLVPPIKNTVVPPKQAQPGLPVRLKIPSVNVDAPVEFVSLTPDGAMDVPKSQDNVAWYKLGQRPGENGSAVVAGHYGVWDNGRGSVFDSLKQLQKGDRVYVEDEKGVTYTFLVREFRDYDPNADATSVFVSNDGKSHLNIITCEGVWNKVSKSYSERLVVFTDKE